MNDPELQYYLYMSDDWRGPYPVAQIRSFLKLGQIDDATYAYEPQHQSQLTVSDLLAGRHVMPQVMGSQAASGFGSSGSHEAVEPAQPATARFSARQSGRLDDAINALDVMRSVCFSISGTDGRERDDLLDDLKQAYDTIREVLDRLRPSLPELRNFAVQIDKVASDIAARLSDRALTAHLVDMRDCVAHADPDEIIPSAEAVIAQVAHLARTAGEDNPFEIVDDEATPNKGHPIDAYESARFELKSLQTDLSSVKDAYSKLQEAYANEQKQARRLVLQLKEQLESEQNSHQGDNAELRALAAEIHDLATACGVAESDPGLAQDLTHLAEELQNSNPTTLVPVAESVLNRMVNRLGSDHEELTSQVKELSTVRAELLQLKTDMSILRQREEVLQADKVRIQKQLDEERGAANRVDQSARAREAQLKSTIAALQVTKELHQEVMGDLQEQLQGAQERVEDMERELLSARSELKGTRNTFENREQELVANLDALSRERTELEARQNALSSNLEGAERELALARERAARNEEDESLSEALAAKVNEMRASFEQTRARLREQEGNAGELQKELAAARNEADELRSRSDQLGNELENARGNLDVARRRMEELQRAAARLEAERTSLQTELTERKGTDAILRGESDGGHLKNVVNQLETQVAQSQAKIQALEAELENERQRDRQLGDAHVDSENRYHDLLAEQERLRGELSILRKGAKDPETTRLLREAKDGLEQAKSKVSQDAERITELDERLSQTERALRDASEARSDIQAKLASVASERDRLNGELTRLRAEHEAAAVEHRAAIAAARKAQTESAAKAAELKIQLEAAEAERERLGEEVSVQRALITDAEDTESRVGVLGERLEVESSRANHLERELADSRRELAATSVRFERLREELKEAESERTRLDHEINRRHDASAMRDAVDADGRTRLQDALDRLREQLEREQRRSADLEHRLEAARNDARGAATRHAETAESYADAVARADRVASDLSEERSRNAANLADAERRLSQERERAKNLEARLGELDGRLSAAGTRQQDLEQSLADITSERERFVRDLSEARADKSTADQRIAELTKNLRHTETELGDLRDEVAMARDQRHEVASELASTTGRHSRLAITVDRLTKELHQVRSQLEAAGSEHQAAIRSIQSQLEHELETIATLQQRLQAVDSERTTAVSRANELENRLRQSDDARSALVVEVDRLKDSLEDTAGGLRGEDADVAALQDRLLNAEAELAQARSELEDSVSRGADRLIELEQRLGDEQAKAAQLDDLREKLRIEAETHAEARGALAEVTVARDTLRGDLNRLQEEIRAFRIDADRDVEAHQRLLQSESLLEQERGKVARLEADLAIARSNEQVAAASRAGLEAGLNKVVADRERLICEVDRLRQELNELRSQTRLSGSDQSEIVALKQMLDLERERVRNLEDRLAEAWRKQGEAMATPDGDIRRQLQVAQRRIERLRRRLRSRPEIAVAQEAQPTPALAPDRSKPLAAQTPNQAGQAGDGAGFISAFGHLAVMRDQPLQRSESPGFTSRFGKPAVGRSAVTGDSTRVKRALPRYRLSTILAIVAGIAGLILVAMWVIILPSMFPMSQRAVINAKMTVLSAPIAGMVTYDTSIGSPTQDDAAVGVITNDAIDVAHLQDLRSRLTSLDTDLALATSERDTSQALIDDLQNSLATWRSDRLSSLGDDRTQAATALNALRLQQADAVAKVISLQQVGVADERLETATLERERLIARAKVMDDRVKELQSELDSLSTGQADQFFPSAEQIRTANTRLAAQNALAAKIQMQVAALTTEVATEETRIAHLQKASIHGVQGVLYKRLVPEGRWIKATDPLIQVVHPESLVIHAALPSSVDASIGDDVLVRLSSPRHWARGRILELSQPGNHDVSDSEWTVPFAKRNSFSTIASIEVLEELGSSALEQSSSVIMLGPDAGSWRERLAKIRAIGQL